MKTLLLTATLLAATSAVAAPDAPTVPTKNPFAVPLSPYQAKTQAAHEQFNAKDFAGAQKTIEEALALARTPKEKSDALRRLGQALEAQEQYDKAREIWQKMLPMIQNSPDDLYLARLLIAATYTNQKLWQSVVDALPALIDDPHTQHKAPLRLQLAKAYSELQQGEKARAQITRIMDDDEDDAPTELRILAQLIDGESYLNEAKLALARQSLEATTQIEGASDDVRIGVFRHLGEIALRQNRADDAATAFARARALLMKRADAQFKAEDWNGAIASYKGALEVGTPEPATSIVAHLQIGAALEQQEKYDEARAEFQTVIDMAPVPDGATQKQIQGFLQPGAFLGVARTYIAQKQFDQARQTLDALQQTGNVLPLYDAQIAKLRAMLSPKQQP